MFITHSQIKQHIFVLLRTIVILLFRSDQWVGFYPTDDSVITKPDVDDRRYGWAWLDRSAVTWLTWKAEEPTQNTDGCARLHKDMFLKGKECTHSYYYICKRVSIVTW